MYEQQPSRERRQAPRFLEEPGCIVRRQVHVRKEDCKVAVSLEPGQGLSCIWHHHHIEALAERSGQQRWAWSGALRQAEDTV
jgi:hypothetical protein